MKNNRKKYTGAFRAKVALAALTEKHTINELGQLYELHSTQISKWKSRLKNDAHELFSDKRKRDHEDKDKLIQRLYQQIGQLKVESDWLKKKVGLFES